MNIVYILDKNFKKSDYFLILLYRSSKTQQNTMHSNSYLTNSIGRTGKLQRTLHDVGPKMISGDVDFFQERGVTYRRKDDKNNNSIFKLTSQLSWWFHSFVLKLD